MIYNTKYNMKSKNIKNKKYFYIWEAGGREEFSYIKIFFDLLKLISVLPVMTGS